MPNEGGSAPSTSNPKSADDMQLMSILAQLQNSRGNGTGEAQSSETPENSHSTPAPSEVPPASTNGPDPTSKPTRPSDEASMTNGKRSKTTEQTAQERQTSEERERINPDLLDDTELAATENGQGETQDQSDSPEDEPSAEQDEAQRSNSDPQPTRAKSRKDSHREVERKRRQTINAGIDRLKDLIASQEKNKSAILQRAADFIEQKIAEGATGNREQALVADGERIEAERQRFEAEVDRLEKELAAARDEIDRLRQASASGEGEPSAKRSRIA